MASYPALYLYPVDDTWDPKQVVLTRQRTRIGRKISEKTEPDPRNGYFDSMALSRQHAEVWVEDGGIYIKDTRSSNGTFVNGERLSLPGYASEPFELRSGDIIHFGSDIVGEDKKTVIYHKVAAKVVCVLTKNDVQAASRTEQVLQQQ